MYLRTIKRKNKDGSVVEYVQLAHNVRHPVKGYSKAEVIHSFGRREQLDVDGLKRLVASISRFVDLDETPAEPPARPDTSCMAFVRSLPVGGILILHALWDRFGINACLQKALAPPSFSASSQNALFALVASSALAPFAAEQTILQIVSEGFLASSGQRISLADRHFDHAMDMLSGHIEAVQQEIFRAIASHLNLDLDLVFVDLIPASVLNDRIDSPIHKKEPWASHHYADGPSNGTLALAVSQMGIPIGCWLMPGHTIDTDGIKTVEENLMPWSPRRIVWVMDRPATGDALQNALQQSGCTYILGRTLRDSGMAQAATMPKGRFKILGPDLQFKAPILKEDAPCGQCVITYHPGQAAMDRKARQHHLRRLRMQLENWNKSKTTDNAARPGYPHKMERYLKISEKKTPTINHVQVRQDEKQDGKYLLMSNDHRLPPETLARGHKQLLDIDQIYRELKRTEAQAAWASLSDDFTDPGMLLAWLILLLRRIAELKTGLSWKDLCRDMQGLHLGEFADGNRRMFKYTALTATQKKILQQLRIDLPQIHASA